MLFTIASIAAALLPSLASAGFHECGDGKVPSVDCWPATNDSTTLSQAAKMVEGDFTIGAAYRTRDVFNATLAAFLASEYSAGIAAFECKMYVLEPSRDKFNYTACDTLAKFASDNNMTFQGNTLHWSQALPNFCNATKNLTAEDRGTIISNYVASVTAYYNTNGSLIHEWDAYQDVVFRDSVASDVEFTADGKIDWSSTASQSLLRQDTPWVNVTDRIDRVYQSARSGDNDDTRLFLSETNLGLTYDADGNPIDAHTANVYKFVDALAKAEQPLSGISLSFHLNETFHPSYDGLSQFMIDMNARDLSVSISQLDMVTQNETLFALVSADIVAACLNGPNCRGVKFWGVREEYIGAPMLLFDKYLNKREAYWAVLSTIKKYAGEGEGSIEIRRK